MKSFEEYLRGGELYINEEDRRQLQEMSEVQREKKLYARYQKRRDLEEKRQLREMEAASATASAKATRSVKFEDCGFIVSRKLLTTNVFKPFFSAFKGCFVRAKLNGKYSICKIVGMAEVEPYLVSDGADEMVSTGLNIDSGERIFRQFRLTNISSQGMLEQEFEQFVDAFRIENVESLATKYRRVVEQMGRDLTDEELTKTIENRRRANPKKKTVTEQKIELILKRDAAVAAKNKEKALFYQQEIERMEDSEKDKKRRREMAELEDVKRRLRNQ